MIGLAKLKGGDMNKFRIVMGFIWIGFAMLAFLFNEEVWSAVGIVCSQIWLSKN